MTTYVLVHGGIHGAWCWDQVTPLLTAAGHQVVTPELPFEDAQAGALTWANTVIREMDAAGAGAEIILVGHSMAGLTLPVVATLRRVTRMIFLGAVVPVPGRSFIDAIADEPRALIFPRELGESDATALGASWESARAGFYHDCSEPVARQAYSRLRPMSLVANTERCPVDQWPDVPSSYIVMTEDHAVDPQWSRWVARGRLGADLHELPGSHSPFLSRPSELASLLLLIGASRP